MLVRLTATATAAKTQSEETVAYLRGDQGIPGVPGANGQDGTPGQPSSQPGPPGTAGAKGDTGAAGQAGTPGTTGGCWSSWPDRGVRRHGAGRVRLALRVLLVSVVPPGLLVRRGIQATKVAKAARVALDLSDPLDRAGPTGPAGPQGPTRPVANYHNCYPSGRHGQRRHDAEECCLGVHDRQGDRRRICDRPSRSACRYDRVEYGR